MQLVMSGDSDAPTEAETPETAHSGSTDPEVETADLVDACRCSAALNFARLRNHSPQTDLETVDAESGHGIPSAKRSKPRPKLDEMERTAFEVRIGALGGGRLVTLGGALVVSP